MHARLTRLLCALLLLIMGMLAAVAETPKPFLHPLFASNMVWQRDIAAPIWGWAVPGTKVTVSMLDKTATATTDANGKWMTKLGPFAAGGPYTLTVTGPQTVKLENVLVGDVWLCSGQSNMEFGIKMANNADQEVANATDGNIRLYKVPHNLQLTPKETINAQWDVCSPQTIVKGGWNGFSAVAYFFGRQLRKDVNVPIGLIDSSWGGTPAQAWTSTEALNANLPEFKTLVNNITAAGQDPSFEDKYKAQYAAWLSKNEASLINGTDWTQANYDTSTWKTMKLPCFIEQAGENLDGMLCFRREVQVPESWAGKNLVLNLGRIDDSDETWFNGVKVGAMSGSQNQRAYKISGAQVKAGSNIITVRMTDLGGPGGLAGPAERMALVNPEDAQNPIVLSGDWNYKVAANFFGRPARYDNSGNPTVLYNGMIATLQPFAIKGAIWYQGEANAWNAKQYRTLLPTMITDWRTRFGVGDFPFIIVSLANYMAEDAQPVESQWAELRESQFLTTKAVSNCGIAMAIDIGDPKDIHPKNKQEVGRRLALSAESIAYGKHLDYSGPVYKKMTAQGNAIRLEFDQLCGGLVVKGDTLKGFAIAGADKKFVWANAVIEGNTVVVSSPTVAQPVAVRYDWGNNPLGNLYNKAGLPTVPFRTDMP
ncbi:MAG TPA: sialate O-acetylesterase [Armatimonadota bacterium]|nr:sialate O-acetylesterase [Armatimonadota bacterium]